MSRYYIYILIFFLSLHNSVFDINLHFTKNLDDDKSEDDDLSDDEEENSKPKKSKYITNESTDNDSVWSKINVNIS